MSKKFFAVGIITALLTSALAAQQGYPRHSFDCSTDHLAETWQGLVPPDSCITGHPGDPESLCDHDYGPAVWASIDPNGNSCATGIACAQIWCPAGAGWTLKYVSLPFCPGRLQADDSGVTCFMDNNGDGRFTTGDTLLSKAGC